MEPSGSNSEGSGHNTQPSQKTRPPRHRKGAPPSSFQQDSRRGSRASHNTESTEDGHRRSSHHSRGGWSSGGTGRGSGHRNQGNRSHKYYQDQPRNRDHERYSNRKNQEYDKGSHPETNANSTRDLDGSINHPEGPELSQPGVETSAMGHIVNGRYVRKSNAASSISSSDNANVTDRGFAPRNEYKQHGDYGYRSQHLDPEYNLNDNQNFYRGQYDYSNQDRDYRRPHRPGPRITNNAAADWKSDKKYQDEMFSGRGLRGNYASGGRHQSSQRDQYDDRRQSGRGYDKNRRANIRKGDHSSRDKYWNEELEDEALDSDHSAGVSDRMESRMNKRTAGGTVTKKSGRYQESTTQRDRLTVQLEKGECECMVCCEHIKLRDYIWSCDNCYHIFHLKCIKKWARSPAAAVQDVGWRCPACQNITENIPLAYTCFCGKKELPEVNAHYTPHSCGEMCGKQREDKNCSHKCNLLCHPGPCPPCLATVNRPCECEKTSKVVPCNQTEPITCGNVCGKVLNCGIHTCKELCHKGLCESCIVILNQECFCRASKREVICDEVTSGQDNYSCGHTCGRLLACRNHKCSAVCHSGPCQPCNLLPQFVITCPCSKIPLEELYRAGKATKRLSCTDPIPTCGQKCEKELPCGPKDDHHKCSSECHEGECPPCPLVTVVKCQCLSTSKEVKCVDWTMPYIFKCERRCNKRKNCGRHKCLNHCCTMKSHVCELICNKKLSCGNHQCPEACHGGNCPPCWNVSFDELRCHCGHSVLYPPVNCGTRPPECDQPCAKPHPCNHKVQHTCHSEPTCPPCTMLVEKWCFGEHEKRSNVQCFLDGISCGKQCNKPLPCGNHKCREVCHSGACLKPDAKCTQPCEKLRSCGHPCCAPCHDGPCPDTPCRTKVTVTCPCGFRTESETCSEDGGAYRLVSLSRMAAKMNDIKYGESVNIGDIFGKKNKYNRLLCNEDCAIHERNKRLAVALQIQNPDLSCKPGPPSYSEFLKEEAKKNQKFVSGVYDKFVELVQLAKQSKQKSRSYAFPPMNRDHRRVVHEMAEFFGCETQSYDEEPVKNVVITAFKDRSWLPFVSLATVVEREMGLRRGPAPVINSASKVPVQVSMAEKKSKPIDYFDYEG